MRVREWWYRLRNSLRRTDALEREMDREMRVHLEMAAQRNRERDMPADAAMREARLSFGSAEAFKEEGRDAVRARVAENIASDIRFALRSLRRAPAFTISTLITLTIGIGASAAIFSVVNAVLLRPLPIPDPGEFRHVGWNWSETSSIPALTELQFEFLRDNNRVFEAVAAYRAQEVHLGDETASAPVRGLEVTAGFFGVMKLATTLGRPFHADEFAAAGVVILGDDTWRTRFGADSGIIGREIRLGGAPRTVIGVLPRDFRFPPEPRHTGYLLPLMIRANPADEGNNTDVVARLRAHTPAHIQEADVRVLSEAFRAAYPAQAAKGSFRVYNHVDASVSSAEQRTLWILFGAIGLVLLMACANTATLLLIRALARQREIAVRASIGASTRRIMQQLLTEGLVLSGIGTLLGVAFSALVLAAFRVVAPNAIPAGAEPVVDWRVLAFASCLAIVTGVSFGLATGVPSLRARIVQGGSHGTGVRGMRLRHSLVFVQSAVAVVLLSGASLLGASFTRLVRVDPGFDVDRVTTVRLGTLPRDYDAARRNALVERLTERMRAIPGVERVAAAPNVPLERGMNFPIDTPERPDLAIGAVELRFVSPEYLETLGIPLVAGRPFDERDVAGAEPVAIVNEAFARHYWQDSSAVGRTIQIGHFRDRWRIPRGHHQTRVIAVAADIHEVGLDRPAKPTVLVSRAQNSEGKPLLLVRTSQPMQEALRAAVIAEEPRLAPVVERMSDVVNRSVAAPRFRAMLVGSFALFAVLLAGVGIYGVIASGVQHRRREIAVRIALGASTTAIGASVARRCLISVVAGVLAGFAGFWVIRRVLTTWLFNMTPGDPLVLSLAVAVLVIVAMIASWIPTRRAARVDPAMTLRLE